MKKLSKNKYLYTILIIMSLIFFNGVRDSYYMFDLKNIHAYDLKAKEECEEIVDVENVEDLSLGEKIAYDNCVPQLKYNTFSLNGYSVYTNILLGLHLGIFVVLICPILILFTFVLYICKIFKSKSIKQVLLRENYKKFLQQIFTTSYRNAFIMPIFLIIIFLLSWKWAGHLVYQAFPGQNDIPDVILDGMPLNAIPYLLNIVLLYTIIISIALICASKNKNPILVILETIIILIGLEYFNELFLERIVGIFGIDTGGLSFLNLYSMSGSWNIWVCTLELLIYNIIIGIGVYFSYRNKEKIIQMCER